MSAFRKRWLVLSILTLAQAVSAADEANVEDEPEPPRDPRRQEVYRREAAAYEFTTAGDGREPLEFRPEPVMQWVSLNDYDGEVFVWTRGGRPEVVGTIFSFPAGAPGRRNVMHEFHSLGDAPVGATGPDGRTFSMPKPAGLTPIPAAPAPAKTAAARRLQARALAREFSARMQWKDKPWELRLLNQPLYAYGDDSGGVLGGAVFAFVGLVTDPEILLLIDARETAAGPRWHYAAARFSNKSLRLEHQGVEVWRYLADDPPADVPYYLSPAKPVGFPTDSE